MKAGCLPFFQDDIGALSSDGRYVENEPWCLLIRSGTVQRIMSLANHLRQKCTEVVTVETAGPWTLLSFSATSKLFMERLGLEVPAGARKLFSQGWVPAVPRISGVARYGQAVLLTPASNPMVRLEGAISGQYAILNASGVELAGGTLLACEEGLYIPPSQLVELKGQVICRFELKVADSSLNHVLEVAVVDGVPGTPLVWADNRHTWLIDGRLGVRESLAASFLPAGEPLVSPVGRLDHLGGSWPLFAYSPSNAPACMHANLEALHPALAWLADAVSLRFQTRGNMQFGDLDAHLRMAGEAVGIESWRLRRTLISGGWLLPIGSALSPHVSVAAATRTISWSRQGGRVIARIRGMLTTQERAALATMAVSGDCIQRIVDPGMPLAIGCIELDVSDEESVLKISSKLQLHRLPTVEAARDVFGGLISSRTQAAVDAAPVPSGAVSLWDAGSFGWVPERVSREQLPVGAILRSEGRQRHVFHIKMERGYRRTDSRSWALMIKASCAPEGLGTISQCGDVDWAKSLLSLPNALCCWWTHFGGGVVSIGDSGSYAFRGGNGLHLWEGIVDTDRRLQDRHECRATERRARALAILKHKRMQRVF